MIKLLSFLVIIISLFLISISNKNEYFTNKSNCVLIISKKVTLNMYNMYSRVINKNLFFISDKPPEIKRDNIFYYDNKLMNMKGFNNMHNIIQNTSWDKVFYHLQKNLNYDYYWIIEDDVYLNERKFNNFVDSYLNNDSELLLFGWYKSYKDKHKWVHWYKNEGAFKEYELKSAITQVVRLSNKMIKKILEFQEINKKFIFHEILIASIASRNKLKHTLINRKDIHLTSLESSSLLKVNYKNNKADMLDKIKNNMIMVHPFKNWYDFNS